ncbi:MAG: lipoyl(octanoyl) transferase LipB [Candidatus Omnitrophica bacterium]|nr:lipoyl(octanoyl) transferase LipB [Candidatus Omnitrophota bacterium]
MVNNCEFIDWGVVDYAEAYQRQKELVKNVIKGGPQKLIVCEHPAVLTCGRTTKIDSLLAPGSVLEKQGIPVIKVDRGGDITLHSPGQLVIYPIFNLGFYRRDLHVFLRKLEQTIIDLLSGFGIVANRIPDRTGVWVGGKKIASIGIGVSKWVSYHGVGFNFATDLSLFSLIRPCGLDVTMTSLQKLSKNEISREEVLSRLKEKFRIEFDLKYL